MVRLMASVLVILTNSPAVLGMPLLQLVALFQSEEAAVQLVTCALAGRTANDAAAAENSMATRCELRNRRNDWPTASSRFPITNKSLRDFAALCSLPMQLRKSNQNPSFLNPP